MLEEILSALPAHISDPAMLVGLETKDDAVVYRIDDSKAVVATTDFFMPVVDDPSDFGAIAAANALSDIYAVGAVPIFALAVAGMPTGVLSPGVITQIFAGGAAMAAKAGIVVAGGHSIDSPEPIYGLAVVGLVHPDEVKRNSTARVGDVLILGKALGVGILSAAFKKGLLSAPDYRALMDSATKLNSIGADLAHNSDVHAMTDVTGFSLLGHMFEMCEGSGVAARLDLDAIPLLDAARPHAQDGLNTGAGTRNRETFGPRVSLPADLPDWHRNLLFDPQTSGGLLVSVAPDAAAGVLELFHGQGYESAAIIGEFVDGPAGITVTG